MSLHNKIVLNTAMTLRVLSLHITIFMWVSHKTCIGQVVQRRKIALSRKCERLSFCITSVMECGVFPCIPLWSNSVLLWTVKYIMIIWITLIHSAYPTADICNSNKNETMKNNIYLLLCLSSYLIFFLYFLAFFYPLVMFAHFLQMNPDVAHRQRVTGLIFLDSDKSNENQSVLYLYIIIFCQLNTLIK